MRRTIRPNTRRFLVLLTVVIATIVWIGWELGRLRTWRTVAVLSSGLTFVFFALGWSVR